MDRHELYEVWAPPDSPWSAWAKPVLFAHLPRPLPSLEPATSLDLSWIPPAEERRALIVDLPGAAAVRLGLALAGRGYRPVPVFNACPPPLGPEATAAPAVIDVDTILAALVDGASSASAGCPRSPHRRSWWTPTASVPCSPCGPGYSITARYSSQPISHPQACSPPGASGAFFW